MKQPEQFPRALYAANLTSGALYLAVMLAGYYGYGAFINQDIVESMTYSPANLDEAFSGMKGITVDWGKELLGAARGFQPCAHQHRLKQLLQHRVSSGFPTLS